MNPDASTDWASAILGLHQLLCDQLQKAQPGIPQVKLPDPVDWLQAMAGTAPPGTASPLGLEGLPTHLERDAPWESAAQRCCAAASALHAAWLEIGSDTLNALRQALSDDSAPQDLRGIYDLWVSCGEQAFAQQGASERYADLVSELINAQVSLLLACGIGSTPLPQESAALKDEGTHTAPPKNRTAKVGKKKQSSKKAKTPPRASTPDRQKTEAVRASGKRKKTSRKTTASTNRQRQPKP